MEEELAGMLEHPKNKAEIVQQVLGLDDANEGAFGTPWYEADG